MRNILKALLVLAAGMPLAAFAAAGITNSKHDLSSTSGNTLAVSSQSQLCIFCHTPHHALKQPLIWNHDASAATSQFTPTTLASGTPLGSQPLMAPTVACLTCHDGSTAIGAVNNQGGGTAGTISVTGNDTSSGLLVGYAKIASTGAGGMDNNHPVSIPYAGQTYNGVTSSAKANTTLGNYFVPVSSGCTSASGFCTGAGVGQAAVNLYGTAVGTLGIECGSCHEVHNKYGYAYFLRDDIASSAICKDCHNK